jgi:single-strand DNA-binding protein
MLVYIEGKIQTRRWESQDGTARYVTEIVADILRILEKRENREFTQNSQTQNTEANSKSSFDESSKQESQDFMADDDVFGGDDLGNNDNLPF